MTTTHRPLPLGQMLLCGALVVTLSMGIRHSFGLWLQPITTAHGWTREDYSLAMAVQNLVWGAAGPIVGWWADRSGAYRVLWLGALLYALGLAGMATIDQRLGFVLTAGVTIGLAQACSTYAVVYGVVGYKTHAKMILVVRRENGHLRHYVHLGTGNYHAGNAKLYTDYSLLTADMALCEDVSKLFSQLIGMGKTLRMKKLLHAPFTLKKTLLDMIARETALAAEGKPAHIIAKFNSLTDPKIIRALYKASQTGVKIDLVVRGMCCLRPGIAGVSHNIQVRSIIGRFLEHTRVFYFLNGGEEKIYLSSADWMERNLDKRVETCFPVEGKKLILRVKKELESYLTDNTQAWVLQPDGRYLRVSPSGNQNPRSAQAGLLEKLTAPLISAR